MLAVEAVEAVKAAEAVEVLKYPLCKGFASKQIWIEGIWEGRRELGLTGETELHLFTHHMICAYTIPSANSRSSSEIVWAHQGAEAVGYCKSYAGAGPNACHTTLDSTKQNSVYSGCYEALQCSPLQRGLHLAYPYPFGCGSARIRLLTFPLSLKLNNLQQNNRIFKNSRKIRNSLSYFYFTEFIRIYILV
jgi:hypothetical protein